MRLYLFIILHLSILSTGLAEKYGKHIADVLTKNGIRTDEYSVVLGINKNDCDLHLTSLNRVFEFLTIHKATNVLLVIHGLQKDQNDAFFKRYSHYIPNQYAMVNDNAAFDALSGPDQSSFCAVLFKGRVQQVGSVEDFFRHQHVITENIQFGYRWKWEIVHPNIPGFMPASYFFDQNKAFLFDRTFGEIAVFDLQNGAITAAANIQSLAFPKDDIRKTTLSAENCQTTMDQFHRGAFDEAGIQEFKINAIFPFVDSTIEGSAVGISVEQYYFERSADDSTSYKHHQLVFVCDQHLRYLSYYRLQNASNESRGVFVRSLFNSSTYFNGALWVNNVFSSTALSEYRPEVSRYYPQWQEHQLIWKNNPDVLDVSNISRKSEPSQMMVTFRADTHRKEMWFYRNHFPQLYSMHEDGSISSVTLASKTFGEAPRKMESSSLFYAFDMSLSDEFILSYQKDQGAMELVCYSRQGKRLGAQSIKEIPQTTQSEKIKVSLITLVPNADNKPCIAHIVAW